MNRHIRTLVLAAAVLVPSCASFEVQLPKTTTLDDKSQLIELLSRHREEGELHWASRNLIPEAERADAVKKAMAAYEEAYKLAPDSFAVLDRLTQITYYVAYYFTPD